MKLYTNEVDAIIENKIKPNIKRIYEMRIRGLTDKQIARGLGITTKLFLNAMAENEELEEVYESATQLLCSKLRQVAYERALGIDGKTDKEGELVGPDANLALRLLEKLDGQFSRSDKEHKVSVTVEHIIKEISQKRRLELEEKEETELIEDEVVS